MAARFVDVVIESTSALPESLCLRWKASSEPRPVRWVNYESDEGWSGRCAVVGLDASGAEVPAHTCEVEDSAAGTSSLVWGGSGGIVLTLGTQTAVEPYLLLAPDDVEA